MAEGPVLPQPDTFAALTFLQSWPSFPVLSASWTDSTTGAKGKFETKSFPPIDGEVDWTAVGSWINDRQGKANMYFSVNPPLYATDNKNSRANIASLIALHVDVDPRVGETQEAAIPRITALFKAYKTPPSAIVTSGGGVQAFWLLTTPVPINGDEAIYEDVKHYNIQLERDLQGDNCHNVDRIMRIPGTINIPIATKIKKGRKPALAYVVEFDENLRYDISAFTKALKIQEKDAAGPAIGAIKPSLTGNFESMDLADPRLVKLSDKYRRKIVEGDTEGEFKGDRSRLVFDVVCECVRCEIADDVIASILMTREWKVGESVREKKNVDRELNRVIERGHEFAVDRDLAEMNEHHAVVNVEGKTRVMTWAKSKSKIYKGRMVANYSTGDDFTFLHSNRRKMWETEDKDGGKKMTKIPLGAWWLRQERRRQFNGGCAYMPDIDADVVDETLNLWTGFTVAADPAVHPALYLKHLLDNICSGDQTHYDYLIRWMANAVQNRGTPGQIAVVLKGDEGVGKGIAIRNFGSLFGQHFLHVTNPEHLTGKFNSHLEMISVLFADECFYAGDRKHEQILKVLITEPTFVIEPKGVNPYAADNYLHIMMATNSKWAVPISSTGRRWFILHVSDSKRQNFAYFTAIQNELDNGGHAGLLHFLMNLDLTGWDVRNVPHTAEYDVQRALTRRGIDALIESVAADGVLPFGHYRFPNVAQTTGVRRGEGFWSWCRDTFPDLRQRAPESIGRELKSDWGCGKWCDGRGQRGVKFPPLADLRRLFDERHGVQEWDLELPDWQAAPVSAGQSSSDQGPGAPDSRDPGIPF